jgi:hypothetical protein
MFYDLSTNTFTNQLPNVNVTDFLRIEICEHTSKQVVTLISFDNEPLCLHNDSEERGEAEESIAVDLFVRGDESFKKYLDFFA